jgi:hypothetical protein
MGLGDELLASGQAQALYDADQRRLKIAICDVHGQPRWHELWNGNPILATPEEVAAGVRVRKIRNASGCRPYIVYPFTEETGWTFNRAFRARENLGRLYLTPAELARGAALRLQLGDFVLIEPCTKGRTTVNKRWPFERYAAVAEACPDLVFVQAIHDESTPIPGVIEVPKTTFRETAGLLSHAAACVVPEGGLHHAAAVVGCPAVVLFGAFADPEVLGYPQHAVLADKGPGSPCGRWLACDHCAAAMDRITVDDVVAALRRVLKARRRPAAAPAPRTTSRRARRRRRASSETTSA